MVLSAVVYARAGCVAVEGERITGADLARALPAFAKVPADATFGFTPSPGVKRMFSTGQIMRLAKVHGIEVAPEPVCFEYRTELVSLEKVIQAIRDTLPEPGVSIDVVDFIRTPLPPGTFEFPRSALTGRGQAPGLWRGRLKYLPARSLPVWVKVRLSVDRTVVVASQDLAAGKPIHKGTVGLERARVHPLAPAALDSLDAVVGRLPRRIIARGRPIHPSDLSEAPDIERGERVTVEVSSGSALLRFEGAAESGGRAGDRIMIRNRANGKRFRARVVRKGLVAVEGS